jgi:hypothetical protein
MAMSHTHHLDFVMPRLRKRSFLWLPIAIFTAGVVAAGIWVTYILWPRWPTADMAMDAPTLPISVNGVNFNIPPAAIRNKVQRKAGTQERIDLVFLWPSLLPPDPALKTDPVASASHSQTLAVDRVFLTVASYGNTVPVVERLKTIYPRYLDSSMAAAPGGLTARHFRNDTPYQGEDLLYDDSNPERFIVRCTRDDARGTIGMCLYEQRAGQADVTARFPREWLSDWTAVADGLDGLIRRLRGAQR